MKLNKIAIVIIIVIASGTVLLFSRNKITIPENSRTNVTTEKKAESNKVGIIESIRGAMAKSLSVKCEYNTGIVKTVAYIKGTFIRMEASWAGNNTGTLIKNNQIWTWNMERMEGVIMPLQINKNYKVAPDPEEIITTLEKEKQFCNQAVVPDSVFNPPANIKFQDMSKLFEKISGIPK